MDAEYPQTSDRNDFPARAEDFGAMFGMVYGFSISQLVHCAAKYSFAEHLSRGARTADQVAKSEALDPDATFRLLRACASFGLVVQDEAGCFSATPLLMTLHKSAPGSMRSLALILAGPGHWAPWGQLSEAVRTGKMQSQATLGTDLWNYYAQPAGAQEGQAFTEAVAGVTGVVALEAGQLIDTTSVGVAVDVGGASGTLIGALMNNNPHLMGTILDLPHVAAAAKDAVIARGLQARLQVVGGDFLKEVPAGDLYLLQSILCDWPDQDCLTILRNCRRAVRAKGRIVLIEMIVEGMHLPPFLAQTDLTMMVVLGAKLRTLPEFKKLLEAAGFVFTKVMNTTTSFSLIEAVPA